MKDTKLHEECGLFGIWNNDEFDCAHMTYYALYALQHRGQESAGIAVNDDGVIIYHKDSGLVPDVFNEVVLGHLKGHAAIGHVRYSSSKAREDAQPLVTRYKKGTLATAYNGSLADPVGERARLEADGAIFQTTSDTEIINYLLARERVNTHTIEEAVSNVIKTLKGGYSLLVMSPRKLIAARDPLGYRPLCIGKKQGSYIFASESCALDAIGAEFVRDVEPGEVVVVDKDGLRSIRDNCTDKSALCIFEYIYFARPDSIIEGTSVYEARVAAGRALAKADPVEADIVIGVPDSGICAAIGYAEESGIPYGTGLIKNRYIGRTFIQPSQKMREESVDIKLNVLASTIRGKRVIIVDDSIVRGTTCRKLIMMLKKAGATEVHMRISSPLFLWPCYFGTDVPTKEELIGYKYSVEEMREKFGADSLSFLRIEDLKTIVPGRTRGFCDACFTGKYDIEIPENRELRSFQERRLGEND
ncbi:MAG: amidophosphoribosyltransferase [Clostridia bacterium]|nr:amidophosphoribosyltransferase [Clostridia bacterium]